MKKPTPVGQLIDRNEKKLKQPSATSTTSTGKRGSSNSQADISLETKALINMIFARFQAIYTHKYESAYNSEVNIKIAKREWGTSLQGYTEQQLSDAVNICKETFSWPPVLADFLTLLKPSAGDYGLPEPHAAYLEACGVRDNPRDYCWSHEAVYHAAKATDWFILHNSPEKQAYPVFSANYEKICERFFAGETLNISLPKAIENRTQETYYKNAEKLAEKNQIDISLALDLLFYTTKQEGSSTRKHFREISLKKIKESNLEIELLE